MAFSPAQTGQTTDRQATIRRIVIVFSALVIALNAGFLVFNLLAPDRVTNLTDGVIPPQYFSQFDAEPLSSYDGTHGIGHNTGDSLDKIAAAVAAGAQGIEIDVIEYRGDLYARHNLPVTVFGEFGYRPIFLSEAWDAATTEVVQLDLKDTAPRFLQDVSSFLALHEGDRRIVMVSSWDLNVLRHFQETTPWVGRLLSVGSQNALDTLFLDFDLIQQDGLLNGVTILHDLLDASNVVWFRERNLLIFAWTVENLSRVNELTLLGVDAIVTDNLAILYLLRSTQSGELLATPEPFASPAVQEPADTPTQDGSDQ